MNERRIKYTRLFDLSSLIGTLHLKTCVTCTFDALRDLFDVRVFRIEIHGCDCSALDSNGLKWFGFLRNCPEYLNLGCVNTLHVFGRLRNINKYDLFLFQGPGEGIRETVHGERSSLQNVSVKATLNQLYSASNIPF